MSTQRTFRAKILIAIQALLFHKITKEGGLVGAETPFEMLEGGPQHWGLGALAAVQ